jgi:nitrogen fixation protein NifU and related proteins
MAQKTAEAKQLAELGYTNRAIELYQNQQNVGVINDSDADATVLGISGELIRLYLTINDDSVRDAKFLCYGCPAASAAMSALTLLIIGKPLLQAKKVTKTDILSELGGLPEPKQECSELPIKTLKKALAEYEKTNSQVGNSSFLKKR